MVISVIAINNIINRDSTCRRCLPIVKLIFFCHDNINLCIMNVCIYYFIAVIYFQGYVFKELHVTSSVYLVFLCIIWCG